MGLTWLKMDLGINMVADTPGTVTAPSGLELDGKRTTLPHPFLATEVTDKGIEKLVASMWRRRAKRWAWRSRFPWIIWAISA